MPAATAAGLAERRDLGAGHVGMMVGGRAQASEKAKIRATGRAPARAAAAAVTPAPGPEEKGTITRGKGSEKGRLASAPEPEAVPADAVPAEAEPVADAAAEASPGEQANGRRKDK